MQCIKCGLFAALFQTPVPFSLGILITNGGFGVANNFQLATGLPQIIDNQKGLLVKFQIVGFERGNVDYPPTFSVNFGDIQPFTTQSARWLMMSSLSGIFNNFSATFTNTNPLGNYTYLLLNVLSSLYCVLV